MYIRNKIMVVKRNKRKSIGLLATLLGVFFVLMFSILLPRVNLSSRKSLAYSVLNFPADHGSHPSYNAEWWYLNLLTRTTKADGADQRDLAYVLSFSRILGSNNLLSSRYDNTSKSFREGTEQAGSLVVQLVDGSRLFVQFSKGLILTTLEELATGSDRKKVYHLTGRTAYMGSFDLTLKERTVVSSGFNTPLLWGGTTGNCQGKISVFAQDDTYYYSVPDLDITGTITDLDGTRRNVVTGKAWMDHQWFNGSPPSNWKGHYWTNFHFTNSSDLYNPGPHQALGFVTQIYSSGPRYTYWVKRNANGTNECGTNGTVVVKSYGSTNYPNSWTFNNGPLNANGSSFSDNQIFQPPVGPKFIEAASYYSGNLNGVPFTGLGFFETHRTSSLELACASWESVKLGSCTLSEWSKVPKGSVCYTTSNTVTVNMDSPGATQVRFQNVADTLKYCNTLGDSGWSSWEVFNSMKSWTLLTGLGDKKVCVQFKTPTTTSQKCGGMITRK